MSYKVGDVVIITQVTSGGLIPAGVKCTITEIKKGTLNNGPDHVLVPVGARNRLKYIGRWLYGEEEFCPVERAIDRLRKLIAEIK